MTVKIRPVPPVRRHGGLMFPDFVSGVRFMRQVAAQRRQPASIRLMDNEQFKFGQSWRPALGLRRGGGDAGRSAADNAGFVSYVIMLSD